MCHNPTCLVSQEWLFHAIVLSGLIRLDAVRPSNHLNAHSLVLEHAAGEKSLLDQDIPSLVSKFPNGDFATSDLYSAISAGNFPQW